MLSQSGSLKCIGYLLFVVGVLLCLFPIVSRCVPKRVQKDNVIGELRIPKIKVELPIFADVEEEMLEQGAGHIKGSAIPRSGNGTHCVLAGHRGLPGADLLARLGELEVGDIVQVSVEGFLLSYRVCKVQVIRPDEVEIFRAEKERELLSIVTCTPYGINTHRLVVTAERMK